MQNMEEMTGGGGWSSVMGSGSNSSRWGRRLALIAFGEESERVDLPNEVRHASPSSKPEPDHEYPRHHKGVQCVHSDPARHEERRLLRRILQRKRNFQCLSFTNN